MTKEFLEDIRSLMVDSLEEKKKLDPVGKADADIDNDGDVDDSDEYLHKRRKAIGKAMKDEGNEFTGALAKARANNEKTFTCAGKEYEVKEVEEYEKDLKKQQKDIKEDKEQIKRQIDQARAKVAQLQRFKQNATNRNQARKMQQKIWDAQDRLEKLRDKYEQAAGYNVKDKNKNMKEGKVLNDIRSFLEESIGTARIPDAGKDSSGIRKAVGKDGDSDGGMSNKEKVGYNALHQIAKKLNKAYNDEATANDSDAEERAIDAVQKYRAEFQSKAKFYKDATAKKARADANKAVPPKQRG